MKEIIEDNVVGYELIFDRFGEEKILIGYHIKEVLCELYWSGYIVSGEKYLIIQPKNETSLRNSYYRNKQDAIDYAEKRMAEEYEFIVRTENEIKIAKEYHSNRNNNLSL